jgi:hypothetical protein
MVAKRIHYYSGILAEPLSGSPTDHGYHPDKPPPWFLTLGGSPERWRDGIQKLIRDHVEGFVERHLALYAHFGIDPKAPGADMDLALSLANRHEHESLQQGKRVAWAALCEREGIDPALQDSGSALARTLACKHVPGMKIDLTHTQDWGTKFSSVDLLHLLTAAGYVDDHLRRSGRAFSARAIAEILLDKRRLQKIIPPAAAEKLHAIFRKYGNRKREVSGSGQLSDRALRGILKDVRTLGPMIRGRKKLSDRQLQIWLDVLPRFDK